MAAGPSLRCTATGSTASFQDTPGYPLRCRTPTLSPNAGCLGRASGRSGSTASTALSVTSAGRWRPAPEGYAREHAVDVIVCGHTHQAPPDRVQPRGAQWQRHRVLQHRKLGRPPGELRDRKHRRRGTQPLSVSHTCQPPTGRLPWPTLSCATPPCRLHPDTKRGMLERMFARMFEGLVYAQIWEDPEIDMAALELGPTSRTRDDRLGRLQRDELPHRRSDGDLRRSTSTRRTWRSCELKLSAAATPAALRGLPFVLRRGGHGPVILRLYDRFVAPHLASNRPRILERARSRGTAADLDIRPQPLPPRPARGRRSSSGTGLPAARQAAKRLLDARDSCRTASAVRGRSWRRVFDSPLLCGRLADFPAAYFGLGIPPAQFDALRPRPAAAGDVSAGRVERLACDFPIHENWFAWQAFGRRYPGQLPGLPPYLRPENFAPCANRVDRVNFHRTSR